MGNTVVILLDAFCYPELVGNDFHLAGLKPHEGYCERYDIFTGRSSTEDGLYNAYEFESVPESSSMGITDLFHYYKTKVANKYLSQNEPILYTSKSANKKLRLTEDKTMFWDEQYPIQTLFHHLRDQKIDFDVDSFTYLGFDNGTDKDRINVLKEKLHFSENTVFFLYIGIFDYLGHYFINHDSFHDQIRTAYSKVIQEFEGFYDDHKFLFIGDHGMISVEKYVSSKLVLKQVSDVLKTNKNIGYLIDSTSIQFYAETEVQDLIKSNLEKIDWLETQDQTEQYIRLVVNQPFILSPNLFQGMRKKVTGMHGYKKQLMNMGCLFSNRDLFNENNYLLKDSYHLIIDLIYK